MSVAAKAVLSSAEEIALKHRIDAISTHYLYDGSQRIREQLRRDGWEINSWLTWNGGAPTIILCVLTNRCV